MRTTDRIGCEYAIITASLHLAQNGKLMISDNNLVYLNIDDEYIHRLFPLLQNQQIKKPDYFTDEKPVGAHITAIYPEENRKIRKEELDQEHVFTVKDIVTAEIDTKTYYAILVDSSSLLQLRRRHGLSDMLCFKGYSIGFHITIGIMLNHNGPKNLDN
ncbi:MAG TPA: hypothetical protein DEG23_04115 [Coxiellaceae bacterium]|nr:hypothetical protein [Coxiellaceae bacterium]